jgi:Ca-activated chloride channel family protein
MNATRSRTLSSVLAALLALTVFSACESADVSSGARQSSGGLAHQYQTMPNGRGAFDGGGGGYAPSGEELWIITPSPELARREPSSIMAQTEFFERGMSNSFGSGAPDSDGSREYVLTDLVDPCGGIVGIPTRTGDERESREPAFVHIPLEHTEVEAEISAFVATVDVEQQFHNPYDGKIEAVYVFPLPQDAAVNEFIMTVGERRIRGIIRPREEAEEIYLEARRQGYVASLLEQERPNIFTQKVANIEPGMRIDVNIRYFHTLAYDDGWYEWVFPMVVGPRFNPPARGTSDPVRALPRTAHGGGSGTNVHYLAPQERTGHDISLTCEIEAGVDIEEIECSSHDIETSGESSSRTTVRLSRHDSIPNRDFVLRYRVAGDRIKTAMLTQHNPDRYGGAGHFALMVYPPDDLEEIERRPLELVIVIDCSGSMSGEPLDLAQEAAERLIESLEEDDAFQIMRFSNEVSAFARRSVEASEGNIDEGVDYIRRLTADGGTMMAYAMDAAIESLQDSPRSRDRYIVFLTDGFIGNDAEVLGLMQDGLDELDEDRRPTRVFSFGIGSSPNRFLLERLASLGDGAAAFVGLSDSPTDVVDRFVERASHPPLTDLEFDCGAMQVRDLYPADAPDLFVGRPVIITGRFEGEADARVRIEGRAGSHDISIPVRVKMHETALEHDGVACVWARSAIADLENRAMVETHNREIPDIMERLALQYNLVSARTSFVAVDSSSRTDGQSGTTVPVAVPVPQGVRYETTVGRE